MANSVQDVAREMLINALEGGRNGHASGRNNGSHSDGSSGGLSGVKGVAAGAGAAALAPLLMRKLTGGEGLDALGRLVKSPGSAVEGLASTVGDHVGAGLGDKVSDKVDESGGASGILKDTVKGVLPFGGGDGGGGSKGGVAGVGRGRRMPVQQSVDIGAPLETVYNQWTQFEVWPTFMHRVTRVTQEDDCTVSFASRIWGRTKEFTATIETQRPNERIKWRVTSGMTHTGVVTFHELGPNLTRVLLGLDVEPGSLIEKLARGARHVKRAARADLHRFKAFVEMAEKETGAWRGVIEGGEVVEEHDPAYDEQREYADLDDLIEDEEQEDGEEPEDEEQEDGEEPEDEEQETPRARPRSGSGRTRATSRSSRRDAGGTSSGARSRSRAPSEGSSSKSGASRGRSSRSRSSQR